MTSEHFLKARQLVVTIGSALRTLDALHLATAIAIAESITLMTADRELAKATKLFKHRVILLK
ncbi:MAG: PIN domain-containing protein [Gammaproteobacteria bacterium]|nr:PIN domain-containing protein [Gammaproteobacteria bacterium]